MGCCGSTASKSKGSSASGLSTTGTTSTPSEVVDHLHSKFLNEMKRKVQWETEPTNVRIFLESEHWYIEAAVSADGSAVADAEKHLIEDLNLFKEAQLFVKAELGEDVAIGIPCILALVFDSTSSFKDIKDLKEALETCNTVQFQTDDKRQSELEETKAMLEREHDIVHLDNLEAIRKYARQLCRNSSFMEETVDDTGKMVRSCESIETDKSWEPDVDVLLEIEEDAEVELSDVIDYALAKKKRLVDDAIELLEKSSCTWNTRDEGEWISKPTRDLEPGEADFLVCHHYHGYSYKTLDEWWLANTRSEIVAMAKAMLPSSSGQWAADFDNFRELCKIGSLTETDDAMTYECDDVNGGSAHEVDFESQFPDIAEYPDCVRALFHAAEYEFFESLDA